MRLVSDRRAPSPTVIHRHVQHGTRTRTIVEAGTGRRAVLCIHGFPDIAATWSPILERLSARGFRCVAPSLPGFGETPPATHGNYRACALARDTLALLDALGIERATVVGHDWGAVAAYACAALAPERVDKLVILGLPPLPILARNLARNPRHILRLRHLFYLQAPVLAEAWLRRDNLSGIERLWRRWSPGWTIPAEHIAAVKDTFRTPGTLTAALAYYRQSLLTALFRPRDAVSSLQLLFTRISVPTLLIAGARDGGIAPEMFSGAAQHFDAPFAFEVVPEAGHFAHRERPDAIASLIGAFLDDPPATSSARGR